MARLSSAKRSLQTLWPTRGIAWPPIVGCQLRRRQSAVAGKNGQSAPISTARCLRRLARCRCLCGWLAGRTGKPYRLLSEAEWEYAAGAASGEPWPGGDPRDICLHANVLDQSAMVILQDHPVSRVPNAAVTCDDGAATRAPVGQYRANAFGINVWSAMWEWVADCSVLPMQIDRQMGQR